ncbi:kinesin-like protein KIF15 isoform X1 [Phymastichus coffea]|uniref:kinesin-like protein KIF15 isoform X1 n=1 Tax=Phymastichus coffea TaxID=108790 RepID=UPI00273C16FE|nr:kinesin-like protein KIF15 isoform X1 [Phymastichus coffea]
MSSIDDSSLISGISNISRISKVHSSTSTFSKFDSTFNIFEWQSKSFATDKEKLDLRKVPESTKTYKALSSCEEISCDYAKLKLIYDCLKEIIYSENLSINPNIIKKLNELLITHEVKKYLHLPNESKEHKEELTLLGIIDLVKYDFSYQEQLDIKSCLENKLREKIHSFISMYNNISGSTVKEILKSNESLLRSRFHQKGELEPMHWKDKIDEVCIEYKRDLLYCQKMISQWKNLKEKVHERNFKKSENFLLRAEVAELKAIITKLSCTKRMFTETPATVDAFKILNTSLDEKIAYVSEEITEKIEQKKAYDTLSSTEYDEILRKYLEISHVIKKKKCLLDQL